MRRGYLVILIFIVLFNIAVWGSVYAGDQGGKLTVSFLNVGQGDATYIKGPGGIDVLIDGGPNKSVLRELSKEMSFFDRQIDVVIATHPDLDHIGGLISTLERYKSLVFITTEVESESEFDDEMNRIVSEKNINVVMARSGMSVPLGDGAVLEILYPFGSTENFEPNRASVISRISYGDIDFLLTGDAPIGVEDYLVSRSDVVLESEVLKAGHHGSKTSSSENFLEGVSPEYVIISAGKDNRYGHPHKEVLERFNILGSQILETAEQGTITFKTDGKTIEIK